MEYSKEATNALCSMMAFGVISEAAAIEGLFLVERMADPEANKENIQCKKRCYIKFV